MWYKNIVHCWLFIALWKRNTKYGIRILYDVYGKRGPGHVTRDTSFCGNPYLFQGKRFDVFDDGDLILGVWPYRNYSTYTGRWLQHEKLGMIPGDDVKRNPFGPHTQYTDGSNLYLAFGANPVY